MAQQGLGDRRPYARHAARPDVRPDVRRMGLHPEHWVPVALTRALRRGKLLPVQFAGEPIVLMRSATGRLHAFADRCPHRQFPLHKGAVDGEQLVCGYHAWRFDGSGRCAELPYLGRSSPPASLAVRRYPCREASGFVFVYPGDPVRGEATDLPAIPGWDPRVSSAMYFSRRVACHYSFMHENLMDMNHQFLHRRLMGSIEAELADLREGDDRVEVVYRLHRTSGRMQLGGSLLLRSGVGGQDSGTLAIVTIRSAYPHQMLNVRRPGQDEPSFHMWGSYVPVDRQQRACHTLGMVMIRRPRVPGVLPLLWPFIRYFTESIFSEDREAVEAEQRAYDAQGGNWNREVFPVTFRVQDLLRRKGVPLEADAENEAGPPRRHGSRHP